VLEQGRVAGRGAPPAVLPLAAVHEVAA
jgi:hypothetical protein